MRLILALCVAGLLAGCGKATQITDVVPYLEQFKKDARANGRGDLDPYSVTIIYSNEAGSEVDGFCTTGGVIMLSSRWFKLSDESRKKCIVYHELGHCLMGMAHSTNPDDIMYPSGAGTAAMEGATSSETLRRFFSR